MKDKINLRLFDGNLNTNVTTDSGMSVEMKKFYDDRLIDLAGPNLVYNQFGQKRNIPKNGGKTIEFRKYDSLPKATTPLTEGITPDGHKLNTTNIEATVHQYGDFIALSDVLLLTAIDQNLLEAVRLLGDQAGRTLDTITRDILCAGTNVQFGTGRRTTRYALVGGSDTAANNDYMSVDTIRRAVRALKVVNAQKINGYYVAVIHPDAAYDLMSDPKWQYPHQYQDTTEIYEGEIGRIEGVRFVESSEAKVFHAADLSAAARTLTVASKEGKVITIDETLTSADQTALVGRKILIAGAVYTVKAAAASTITVIDTETLGSGVADNAVIYPGEAGAAGRDVYATLLIAENAYGVTEVTGGGLSTIVKQLGSGGTADPLDQRATAGWKALHTAVRLVEQYMVRIETASTFEVGAN